MKQINKYQQKVQEKKNTVEISAKESLTAARSHLLASAKETCEVCHKEFGEHPYVSNVRRNNGEMYLVKICGGALVNIEPLLKQKE